MILLYVFKPSWVQTRNCVTGQCTVDLVYAAILSFVFSVMIGVLALGIAQSVLESRVNAVKAQAQQAIAEVRAEATAIGDQVRAEFRTLKEEADVLGKDVRTLYDTVRTNSNVNAIGRRLAGDVSNAVEGFGDTVKNVARTLRSVTPRR